MSAGSFKNELVEASTKAEPFEESFADSVINESIRTCGESSQFGRKNAQISDKPLQFPVQIVRLKGNVLELDVEGLERILLNERVRDKPVVVVSIVGGFRMGKSFMLNFLLRYLGAESENWLDAESEDEVKGFEWKNGIERVTTGIWLWSHPFICKIPSIGEAAVLVMDTQGLYDRQSSLKDCCNLFALSVLLSSVQVYNLQGRLQTSDLEHLQFFGEYAKMFLDGKAQDNEKPFHRLTLLIRDWQLGEDCGWKAGEDVLKTFFAEDSSRYTKDLRESVRAAFEKIDCFLMPHPGKAVATGRRFHGKISEVDGDFIDSVCQFVPELLAPGKVVVKKIAGHQVDCAQFFGLLESYVKAFAGVGLPEPKVVFQCVIEVTNLTALQKAGKFYNTSIEDLVHKKPLASSLLKLAHENVKKEALQMFENMKKMGGPSASAPYARQLESSIATKYASMVEVNRRNIDILTKMLRMKAENSYKTEMEQFLGNKYVEPDELFAKHEQICKQALKAFQNAVEVGGDPDSLLGFFEIGLKKARTQNELARALQSNLDARAKIAEMDAENKRVSVRIAQLEHENLEKDCKVASLEAKMNRLTIQQSSAHNDSGYEYSPSVYAGYSHSPASVSFSAAVPATPVSYSSSSSKGMSVPRPAPSLAVPSPGATPPGKVYVSGYTGYSPSVYAGYSPSPASVSFSTAVPSTPVSYSSSSSKGMNVPRPAPSLAASPGAAPPGKVYVSGYTRNNGTVVAGYYRSARGTKNT